jgi:hypothetical protein
VEVRRRQVPPTWSTLSPRSNSEKRATGSTQTGAEQKQPDKGRTRSRQSPREDSESSFDGYPDPVSRIPAAGLKAVVRRPDGGYDEGRRDPTLRVCRNVEKEEPLPPHEEVQLDVLDRCTRWAAAEPIVALDANALAGPRLTHLKVDTVGQGWRRMDEYSPRDRTQHDRTQKHAPQRVLSPGAASGTHSPSNQRFSPKPLPSPRHSTHMTLGSG